MSAWSGQVRVDIQLISWNAFWNSHLRRLTGSNLLTFFLTYLLTSFLTYLLAFFLAYFLTVFLTYLLTFFLTYLMTYLLAFFLTHLLTFFWHIFWHSFWHSFWHIFWHSFWHILWHSFWHIFWHSFRHILWHSSWHIFWHIFLTFYLTYPLTFFLTFLATNCLSRTKHSIHSFTQKPLHEFYIYLTPRSKSNIHDDFASVKCHRPHCIGQTRQEAVESKDAKRLKPHASDSPAKKPLSPRMPCKWAHSRSYISWSVQTKVRCLPLCLLHLFGVTGPARHSIGLPLMHSNIPKGRQSSKDLPALLIWNSSPCVNHMPQSSIHNFWHNEHTIPSMRSARRIHAHLDALRSNCSQDIAPHILNSLCKPAGRANQDCRRRFHHNLRHGCQTKLTCLRTKSWATSICCSAPHQMTQH